MWGGPNVGVTTCGGGPNAVVGGVHVFVGLLLSPALVPAILPKPATAYTQTLVVLWKVLLLSDNLAVAAACYLAVAAVCRFVGFYSLYR